MYEHLANNEMVESWVYSFKLQDEIYFFHLKKILDICFFLSIIIYIEKIKISFSKVGKNWKLENARINF